jgi:hypothetical protein
MGSRKALESELIKSSGWKVLLKNSLSIVFDYLILGFVFCVFGLLISFFYSGSNAEKMRWLSFGVVFVLGVVGVIRAIMFVLWVKVREASR